MVVFEGWMVNGNLQKEPPQEWLDKLFKAFEETCNVELTPKEKAD